MPRLFGLIFIVIFTFVIPVHAEEVEIPSAGAPDLMTFQMADWLHEVGLFAGTETGYALEQPATRAQAAVMLVRLLGKEDVANEAAHKHPFTDVPQWAGNAVGYMYSNGISNGISITKFGSSRQITAQDYVTMLLRAMKYKDVRDFESNESVKFAVERGMFWDEPQYVEMASTASFLREHLVFASFRLLDGNMYDEEETLAGFLCSQGILTYEQLAKANIKATYWQ